MSSTYAFRVMRWTLRHLCKSYASDVRRFLRLKNIYLFYFWFMRLNTHLQYQEKQAKKDSSSAPQINHFKYMYIYSLTQILQFSTVASVYTFGSVTILNIPYNYNLPHYCCIFFLISHLIEDYKQKFKIFAITLRSIK